MIVKLNDFAKAYQKAAKESGVKLALVDAVNDVNVFVDVLVDTLSHKSHIMLYGMGTIVLKRRKERKSLLPSGEETNIEACVSCSIVKTVRKDASNLIQGKKVTFNKLRPAFAKNMQSDKMADLAMMVFQRFLLSVKNGRYSAFYIHKMGRFSHKPCATNNCLKFKPTKHLKDKIQHLD